MVSASKEKPSKLLRPCMKPGLTTKSKKVTQAVTFFDLSAAFDTLLSFDQSVWRFWCPSVRGLKSIKTFTRSDQKIVSSDIFCSKIKLVYGFDEKSISWFRSYLTNRQQVVMIEDVISDPVTINVGSPQGAILSPTIFIILISDIGLYSRHFDTKNIARSHRSSSTGCYCELHTKISSCYNESRSCLNLIF